MRAGTSDGYAASQPRTNHFEEEFEESEAYLEEVYLQPNSMARGGVGSNAGGVPVGSYVRSVLARTSTTSNPFSWCASVPTAQSNSTKEPSNSSACTTSLWALCA